MGSKQVKIIFMDIETSPNITYTFGGKWEVNVAAFKKHFEMLSFAYKWLGEKTTTFVGVNGSGGDKGIVAQLRKVLNEADVIIGHNLDAFDVKKFNSRLVFHKLKPAKIFSTVDTKKVAKRYFGFNSNSLDDLGEYLGLGRKVKHEGITLWLDCMAGKSSAWNKMKKYNIQDVLLLEKVYKRLRPWMQNHPNISRLENRDYGCPTCGSTDVRKEGVRGSHTGLRQQMQCRGCKGWYLTRYSG